MRSRRWTSLGLLSLLFAQPASALAQSLYCVEPIQIVAPRDPYYFPGVQDGLTGDASKTADFWHIGPNQTLVGPYKLAWSFRLDSGPQNKDSRSNFTVNSNRSDTGLMLQIGIKQRSGPPDNTKDISKKSDPRLFSRDSFSLPKLLPDSAQNIVDNPQRIYWSDRLRGHLIEAKPVSKIVNNRQIWYEVFLYKQSEMKWLLEGEFSIAKDLPYFDRLALLGDALWLIDSDGVVETVTEVNPGEGGWDNLFEMGDKGWLYFDGFEYDHALKLDSKKKKWNVQRLIRFEDKPEIDNWILDLLSTILLSVLESDWSRMNRDSLDKIIRTQSCRQFSLGIRRPLFCSPIKEYRNGRLKKIGKDSTKINKHIGDIEALGISVFQNNDNDYFAYDGEELSALLIDNEFKVSTVHSLDLLNSGLLIGKNNTILQIKRNQEKFDVKSARLPGVLQVFSLEEYNQAGAIFLSSNLGVYQVFDGGIYKISSREDLYFLDDSFMLPTEPSDWGGLILKERNTKNYFLLKSCIS